MQFLDFVQDTCPWFSEEFRNMEQGRRCAEGMIHDRGDGMHACFYFWFVVYN
jgi:hypothetical protein